MTESRESDAHGPFRSKGGGPRKSKKGSEEPRVQKNSSAPKSKDSKTVRLVLEGDETTIGSLVKQYNAAMIRIARTHVPSRAIAEEVAQDAWVAFLQGLGGFKGRSSLRTWLFGILINRAKTRGARESRSVSFSSFGGFRDVLESACAGEDGLSFPVCSTDFQPWGASIWKYSPEEDALNGEIRSRLECAINRLPVSHRVVLILRDIEGWSSAEVCDLLEISPQNQRVRLHRARLRVRDSIAEFYRKGSSK